MTDPDRLGVFLNSFYAGNGDFSDRLEAGAVRDGVPVIRKGTQSALRALLAIKKPGTVLEIGTAIGFSAVFFCRWSGARVTTIEQDEERIRIARKNFRESGDEERITLLEGDAARILPGLTEPYDMIFMDAAKGQYIALLPELRHLLPEGGASSRRTTCCLKGTCWSRDSRSGGATARSTRG